MTTIDCGTRVPDTLVISSTGFAHSVDDGCTATRHGTRAAYVAGCRCPDARRANREYAKYRGRRTAKAEFGAAPPFSVPAAHAVAVLDQLRGIGWSLRRIEAATGIGRDHLSRIYGKTQRPLNRVRWATFEQLCALLNQQPAVAPGALVDAYSTWQRVRGLIALGYPKTWIAQQIGHGRALQLGAYVVTARNADKVRHLTDRFGATPGPSDAARRYAAQRGWTADLIWQADDDNDVSTTPGSRCHDYDDIDEIAVERACAGESVRLSRPERLAAVRRLRTAGRGYEEIARRLRVDVRQVHRDLGDLDLIAHREVTAS
jgi:hypothetical protein